MFVVKNCLKLNRKSRVKVKKSSLYVFTTICDLVGPSMALSDLFCGLVLSFMILCLALYALVWPFYGKISIFFSIIETYTPAFPFSFGACSDLIHPPQLLKSSSEVMDKHFILSKIFSTFPIVKCCSGISVLTEPCLRFSSLRYVDCNSWGNFTE